MILEDESLISELVLSQCHAAAMSIREEDEHCVARSDRTMKHNDAEKNGKMMWILCMLREIV
jgi:hypothetical protein